MTHPRDMKCPASIDHGLVHLEDGTCFDLAGLIDTLAALHAYAVQSTLEGDNLPPCVANADVYLEFFS